MRQPLLIKSKTGCASGSVRWIMACRIIPDFASGTGENRIHLTPLDKQTEPPNTAALKQEIGQRWADLELIDILKEVDLREHFSWLFRTSASREVLEPEVLQRRLLLCLFGLGTNVGLKRIASQQPRVSYDELRYVKRRFIQKDALRSAISHIVNGIFRIRQPAIWGMRRHPVRRTPESLVLMIRI